MKLHQADTAGINLFTAYGEDYVAVNHAPQRENLIVLPDRIIPAWTEARIERLSADDLAPLYGLGCQIILLGTGRRLRFPPPAVLNPFAAAGIGIEVMDLQAACRTYNILAAEGRQVAAALLFDRE